MILLLLQLLISELRNRSLLPQISIGLVLTPCPHSSLKSPGKGIFELLAIGTFLEAVVELGGVLLLLLVLKDLVVEELGLHLRDLLLILVVDLDW